MERVVTDLAKREKLREGETLLSAGNVEEERKYLKDLVREDPKNKEAHNNLGVIAFQNADAEGALEHFTLCLTLDPFYRDALLNLVALLRVCNRIDRAIPILKNYHREFPDDKEIDDMLQELDTNGAGKEIEQGDREISASVRHPLKILYIADCRSQHTKRYVRFFKDKGHEVHIFDLSGDATGLHDIEIHCPHPHEKDRSENNFGDLFVHNVFELNRVIDAIKPDILHGHYLTMWCWWGAFSGFQPFVTTAWGSDIFLDIRNDFNRRFTSFCLKESSLVTADSMGLLEATATLKEEREGLTYIPFGIDMEFFRPGYDVSSLASRLGVLGKKVVLSPRQFKPPANIDVIIKAIPKVLAKIPGTVFILKTYLTDGSASDEYQEFLRLLVRDTKVQDHVIFLDDMDFAEIPVLYNLADVMVTLRDTDGSACSMLECMACKTPVIAGDIESMREWIADGVNGRVVDRHSPDAVADAIVDVLLDQTKNGRFVDASYALVHQKADYQKNWSDVESLYYRLTTRRDNAARRRFKDAKLSSVCERLDTALDMLQKHDVEQGQSVLQQIIRIDRLPMHFYLKAVLGLAKVAWIKRDFNNARQLYLRCLRFIQNWELDNCLDIRSNRKETGGEPSCENYPKETEADYRNNSIKSANNYTKEKSNSLQGGGQGDRANDFYENLWNDPGWCSPHPNLDEKARWGKISFFLDEISRLSSQESNILPRILDVGCGRGWMSPLLSHYGSYEGLEPVPPAVDIARKLFPNFNFHKGVAKTILESSDFKPYDIVINTEVIEHVPRDQKEAFAQDLRALLKTNGHLILTTPRGEVFDHMKQNGLDEQPVEDWLTEDEIVNLFVGNGFRAIGCEKIYLSLSNGAFFYTPSQTHVISENLTAIYQVWAFQAIDASKQTFHAGHDTSVANQENPCVSIVIPCYNHARFLKDCLQSIMDQTYANWEAIVVDDRSPDDNPEEVVRSFNDNRITIIRHEQNKGLAASRNTGIRRANADLVVTIDADDMFATTYLEKTVGVFTINSEVDCVFTDYQLFGARQARWNNQVRDAEAMTRAQWLPGAGTLMRRSLWKRIGGYCEMAELRPGNEDWDFWLGASSLNIKAVNLPDALYLYRQHQVSMRSNLKYYDFSTREFIYRRHSQLFDHFHTKNVFLAAGYLDSACEAWQRGERLRAALLAAQGWWLITDQSKPLPVVSPGMEYEDALHQTLTGFENNVHKQSRWLSFGKLAAISIASGGDLLSYFQEVIKDNQKIGEMIEILVPYITFNCFADTGTASNCQQRGEMNPGLIGEAFFDQGNYEEAKKIFSVIIENEPYNEEANNNLGVIAYRQGDLRTAVICFFRALEKNPSYIDALENLAVIFNISEHLPLVISCLEKIALKNNLVLSQLLHSQTPEMSRCFLNLLLQSRSDSIRNIYWDLRAQDIHRQ